MSAQAGRPDGAGPPIALWLNGDLRELPPDSTAASAVAAVGADAAGRGIAVAVDGEVLPRGAWATRRLAAGERVEIVQAVQGG